MAYRYELTIETQDGGTRDIFLHAGEDISEDVIDSLANLFKADPSWLWNINDYVAVQCPFNGYWYRIYQDDAWTFWVRKSPE